MSQNRHILAMRALYRPPILSQSAAASDNPAGCHHAAGGEKAMVLMEAPRSRTAEPVGQGLTEAEVRARRARGEGNDLEPPTSRTYWQIVRANLFTVINTILVGLGVALLVMGRVSDAIITAGIVLINAVINTVQEVRAKRQLDRDRPPGSATGHGRSRRRARDDPPARNRPWRSRDRAARRSNRG